MLSQHEQLRYSRQIMLNKIGEQGQLALREAKVLIVGVGGLGNPASLYLAAAGVGTLFIADGDKVEMTNLQRQILFTENDIGNNKADVGAEKLQQHNSDITIEVVDEMLDEELANYYIEQVDVVLDCTDNITTRYLLNKICVEQKTPLIVGAATGFDGQQLVIDPRNPASACYQCLFPESEKAPTQNCQTLGIVGPVLAIIAGMQSLQAIKLLTGNTIHINQLNLFDGLSNQWQQFTLNKQDDCPVCRTS
ncbi:MULTISPECIES: HesA/MoeB/ThiF family protein [unclassified Colwellia]|uniref:HesA/MoeB/ThiF family protein n=1 Tax=unclassified Colwellia TaxID=196834 RepID=UPI0015F7694B|nr:MULTISPECIES: HesA/MoeB/ThiF family protein [unclassified Colwellia]MBA6362703.1 HesA/MoeB/ThiF family protein [Colwellia sp. BRX8-8]MBA6347040.1 HesA/MoeB/ThiF family protein [Colwellia sp. BRX8-9]MBA6370183.1 HesA/MoeB/ThiF family protein [Colwellia sp. BRX8-4]MBA6377648.1 HesA/MoeB/ThiF family protein [Colwellia sp. BRX10-7]MBA6382473.1 HesA/MoeB/ThiF family protein [Colwellia sp. BRX10-9]